MRTCHRFRSFGEPKLYESWKQLSGAWPDHSKVYLYLRTIITRPDLARRLTSFSGVAAGRKEWNALRWEERYRNNKPSFFNASERAMILTHAQSLFHDYDYPDFTSSFKKGELDAVLPLILSLTPNLETFQYRGGEFNGDLLTGYLCDLLMDRFPAPFERSLDLSKLISVSFTDCDDEQVLTRVEDLEVTWGCIPTVRSAALYIPKTSEHDVETQLSESELEEGNDLVPDDQSIGDGHISPVEGLILDRAVTSAFRLATFLSSYRSLRFLHYTHFDHGIRFHGSRWEPPRVRRALLMVKDTLEYLSLRIESKDPDHE